jgi:hypothetical protein
MTKRSPYTDSGQAFAAAFGGLETVVQRYLEGKVDKEALALKLAETRGLIDDFDASIDDGAG